MTKILSDWRMSLLFVIANGYLWAQYGSPFAAFGTGAAVASVLSGIRIALYRSELEERDNRLKRISEEVGKFQNKWASRL